MKYFSNPEWSVVFGVEVTEPEVNIGAEALHGIDGERSSEIFRVRPGSGKSEPVPKIDENYISTL